MNKSLIIFGIVNITSDSFSDGGRYLAPDAAIAQARKLMAEGADVIDLGPASSNPDAAPVSSDTEIARIAPVLARFDELRLRFDLPVLLSVSRKSFLRALTGRGPGDVGAATLAAELAAAAGGADFIRTHEPRPLRDGLAVLAALKETARIR
ncbi:dihydropteroate synthase [Salmonella enterica subsp. enterica serovar Saintpaul]|nr:dihydropteroate synthase [Salmonella enterica subsp. enterica serovar Saintpaul]EHG3066521.1 dihydropteroate synthase [Salmonella enterica subsp. enterica serovar Saintpaul]